MRMSKVIEIKKGGFVWTVDLHYIADLRRMERMERALEIAAGYAALVASGVGTLPITKERAASDCQIISEALGDA